MKWTSRRFPSTGRARRIRCRVVAAVTPRTVLEEYESLVREAGYNPGAVLPSMIAALGAVDASRPTMVIKVERGTTTFAIVDQNQLLLYRSLENGGSAVTGEALVDDVNTSLVYFEDRYAVGVDRVLVVGVESAQELQLALTATASIRVEELVSSSIAGAGGRQRATRCVGRRRGSAGVLMRFNINLASQPYEAARQFRRRIGAVVAAARLIGALLVGYIVYQRIHSRDINRQLSEVRQEITALTRKRRRRGPSLNKPENRDVADRSEFLNQLFARKALSWTRVFTEMERIVPPDLHVVSMKPEYNKTNDLILHVVVATGSRDSRG